MAPAAGRALLRAALRTSRPSRGASPQPRGFVSGPSRKTCGDQTLLKRTSGHRSGAAFGKERLLDARFNSSSAVNPAGYYELHRGKMAVPAGARGFASDDLPDHQVLTMPSLSPTMTQGNLVEWKKKEGEEVAAGDVLCVIETDKATLDNESQEDGYLAKILVEAGAKDVPVGTPIAVMAESAADVAKFGSFSPGGGGTSATASRPAEGAPAPPPKGADAPSPVPPPPSGPPPSHLGPSVKRLLQESGLDPRTLTGSGPRSIITKGDVLAAIEAKGARPAPAAPKEAPAVAPKAAPSPPPTPPPRASPPLPSGGLPPASQGSYEDLPNSQIRKVIAKRLLESKWGTPQCYLSAEAVIDPTLALRKSLKEKHSTSVSVNDFVVKAVAMALKEVPEANAFFDESSGEVKPNSSVDVCVAVATDRGLMTPIVKNADRKSLSDISAEVKALAEKARSGKLKPEEFMGGTFSISNLGMFPVDHFIAIINPPQAGILAIGKGNRVAVWEEGPDGTGKPTTVTKMEVTLSADSRVIGSDVAGKFLDAVTANLSDTQRLLV